MRNGNPPASTQPTDPDPKFTTHGGNGVTYHRPWDYLLTAILFFALTGAFTGLLTWATFTDPQFRQPAALMLWILVLVFAAMGWWAMRHFMRWRQARIEWAHLTGTPYRGIFVLSSQVARRRALREQERAQRRASSKSRRS